MKYIRTKYGVYKFQKSFTTGLGVNWYWLKKKELPVNENEIVKQADTIEELCDEFVFVSLKDKRTFISQHYSSKEIFEIWQRPCNKCFYQVYGAIWTDKGLIYVANMNSKGELELL